MRKETLVNIEGKIHLGTLEELIKRRFRTYPELERNKVYLKVADYFLDKCNSYDPSHTILEEMTRAYDETRLYLKKLKCEMDEKKEKSKEIMDSFRNEDF